MSLKQQIITELTEVLKQNGIDVIPTVDYPADAKHGDYSTNVAFAASKKMGKNPMEAAEKIVEELGIRNQESEMFNEIHVAKPGFINFWLASNALIDSLNSFDQKEKTSVSGKKIMVEFAHPNTHKAFHIGHLRNITTGESIVRLLEAAGAKVTRVNYQGDVGMHIAKTIHGLTMYIADHPEEFKHIQNVPSDSVPDRVLKIIKSLTNLDIKERILLIGKAYAYGSNLFEQNDVNTASIKTINSSIYHSEWGNNFSYKEVYEITRKWSLDYFNEIYKRVYTKFERFYFESEVYESGRKNVEYGLKKGIFEKSDGAIIFPGSKHNLHDRVFITSEGNPTYEGKEMGLGPLQFETNPDLIIHVVGPEQAGYFQVVFEALAQLFPETKGKEKHLAYGWVKLKHGKMSSRTGNVILGEWLLDEAKKKILESYDVSDEIAEQVAVGAVKYSFLKVGLNQEIAFDLEESISLQGNSGPYLQYTYARTQSVLRKGKGESVKDEEKNKNSLPIKLGIEERELLRLLARFPEIVEDAAIRYAPNILCTYLFELAQSFNLFYQKFPILKAEEDGTKKFRLHVTMATGEVLQKGLQLLGIKAPEQM